MAEVFHLKQFQLKQLDSVFKITTDSILLGSWASFKNPRMLLDVGTGTGILAMMLAQKFSRAHVYGIDINVAAVKLSRENFESSPWSGRLHSLAGDFVEYNFGDKVFDGIVSNPPFFVKSKNSANEDQNMARHDILLTYRDLAVRSAQLLTEAGSVYIIVPYQNLRLLEREFNFQYLFCQKRLYICSKKGQQPKRVIVKFVRKIEECEQHWLYIMDAHGYSEEYKALTGEFYVNF